MSEPIQIQVRLNGEREELPAGLSLAELLARLELHPRLVVVERNGEIVPREAHPEVRILDDDVLELVHFVGGG